MEKQVDFSGGEESWDPAFQFEGFQFVGRVVFEVSPIDRSTEEGFEEAYFSVERGDLAFSLPGIDVMLELFGADIFQEAGELFFVAVQVVLVVLVGSGGYVRLGAILIDLNEFCCGDGFRVRLFQVQYEAGFLFFQFVECCLFVPGVEGSLDPAAVVVILDVVNAVSEI